METHEQAVKRGAKSRKNGAEFETRVRADLEDKGWIVDKWTNNVDLEFCKEDIESLVFSVDHPDMEQCHKFTKTGQLVKAKAKWAGIGRPMMMGAGFPDFIAFSKVGEFYEVIGVESKSNGYLKPLEKEKCQWYLDTCIFTKILIAEKTKVKNKVVIVYHDYEEKYGRA